ncbi:hypothetical protein FQN57_003701 [Myotisia sp. PD_48]|nr:hypothetical protein FQN57_003701 [Myotisia sp. PD_48]
MKAQYIGFAALLLGAYPAKATYWGTDKYYPSPDNCNNDCNLNQKQGFDWRDLKLGDFNEYNGFDFDGFNCRDKFDGKKWSDKFQDKCIEGNLNQDYNAELPRISYGNETGFSINSFQITLDVETDVTFAYEMPDGSKCKETHPCSPGGNTITNTQCGGAKSVKFYIPKYSTQKSCKIAIHYIDFKCGPPKANYPTSYPTGSPPVSTAEPTESTTAPGETESSSDSSTTSVIYSTIGTTGFPTIPVPTEAIPTETEGSSSDYTTSHVEPTDVSSEPGYPTVSISTDASSQPGYPTVSIPTDDVPIPSETGSTTQIYSSHVEPTSESSGTGYPTVSIPTGNNTIPIGTGTPTDGYTTSHAEPTTDVSSQPGYPTGSIPTDGTSTASETGSSSEGFTTSHVEPTSVSSTGFPTMSIPTDVSYPQISNPTAPPTYPSTVSYTTSTIYTTSEVTITSCAPQVTSCPADSTTVVTSTIPISTTVCPVTETNPGPGTSKPAETGTPAPISTPPYQTGIPTESEVSPTEIPSSEVPTTPVTTDGIPTDRVPTEGIPTEGVPTEGVPTDNVPTSQYPTGVPTDNVPTSQYPTGVPTDNAPTSQYPTGGVPTDNIPTSGAPTTSVPTNGNPSSYIPSNPGASSTRPGDSSVVITPTSNALPTSSSPGGPSGTYLPATSSSGGASVPASSGYRTYTPPATSTQAGSTPPNPSSPCPDVVPKCLNTWLMVPKCESNSDTKCFCPSTEFTNNVIQCIQSWGSDDEEIQAALSYFAAICASHINDNPAIITAVPTSITLCPVTPTAGPSGGAPPVSLPETTVTVSKVITISGSQTSTFTTEVTIPQVGFMTTSGSLASQTVVLVPGATITAPDGYQPTYVPGPGNAPVYGASSTWTTVTGTGSMAPTHSVDQYYGAASSSLGQISCKWLFTIATTIIALHQFVF